MTVEYPFIVIFGIITIILVIYTYIIAIAIILQEGNGLVTALKESPILIYNVLIKRNVYSIGILLGIKHYLNIETFNIKSFL